MISLGASVGEYAREYERITGMMMGCKKELTTLLQQAEQDGINREAFKHAASHWRKPDETWQTIAGYMIEIREEMEGD